MKVFKVFIIFFVFGSFSLLANSFYVDEWREYKKNFSFNRSPDRFLMKFVYNDYDVGEFNSKMKKMPKINREG